MPEKGSVGASGDLAPLAHLFLPLIGLGECFIDGDLQQRVQTGQLFKQRNIDAITLGPKEGIVLFA